MSYTFRIHKETPGTTDGWQSSGELLKTGDENSGIGSISDSIEGGNAGKVGTSIPTPFARIYLFETAYAFAASKGQRRESNSYDQLVTQSLDLLQLVFEKGKEEDLKLYEWNGQGQIAELNRSENNEGHRVLANSLNMSLISNRNLNKIILVEYKGVLLGGTSPFTLTYTSPNAIRQLVENRIEIFANDRSQLFKDRNVKHLKDRSRDFQKYILWLVKKNNIDQFTADNSPLSTFLNYVRAQEQFIDVADSELEEINEKFLPKVRRRGIDGPSEINLNVFGDLSLRYNDEPVKMDECDFLMRPSVNCYGTSLIPVVLPTDGDSAYDGWRYTENETWQSYTSYDYYALEGVKVEDRYLPTNGAQNKNTTNKYPWMTTGDFFEPSIVLLGYDLNVERFYFPETGQLTPQFLLPIRREYFKYFTLKDLQENLRCDVQADPRNERRVVSISFDLKIKLQNKDYITLRRTYSAARAGERSDFPIIGFRYGMSFGVFPFYRCPDWQDIRNEYCVYMYGSNAKDGGKFANLSFYKQIITKKSLVQIKDSDTDGRGEGVMRTSTTDSGFSRIYNLRNETTNSFDVVEVNLIDENQVGRGLAVPLWMKVAETDTNKEAIVSIDFGTSNTYVSYLDDGCAHPLTFGLDDQQMVLLNGSRYKEGTQRLQFRNGGNFGLAQYMGQYLREFVPSIIGNRNVVDESEFIEYPIKTATLEKKNFGPEDKLFSSINIGFNVDNEKTDVDSDRFKYVSNLKWSAEEHKSRQNQQDVLAEFNKDKARIQAFCDQTLWMIKNKIIMKGYSSNVKLMYFYPDSMSDEGREIFSDAWASAVQHIFKQKEDRSGFNVELKGELEAISPYYSLLILHGSKIYGKSTANIDVGGGTTDYFILDQSHMKIEPNGAESGKAYEASIFFAGNDLWGATYPQSEALGNYQDNGFVRYMESMISNCPRQAQDLYKCYDKSKGMADFSGFFFKNDQHFDFSGKIADNCKFKFILFLHYSAIIYHFTQIIEAIKSNDSSFRYPEILTFTGKGSEYVKMIAKEPEKLSAITTNLIKAFGIKDFTGLDVISVDNPKALTADGGIYEMMSNSVLRINLFDKDEFGARKSEKVTNTPYERIGKTVLEVDKVEGKIKSDVLNLREQAMSHIIKFADTVFWSSELEGTRNFLKFNLSRQDYDIFLKLAGESYDVHSKRYLTNNQESANKPLDESVFFLALKNTLINLSIEYNIKK